VDHTDAPDAGVPDPPVASAREEYHCPACGAEAHWNPGKQRLICPFCGTESPATLEVRNGATVIVEHDLVAALRAVPDSARGWQTEKTSVRCQSCQAISVFNPERVGQRCEFCGSSALVPYEQVKDPFRPESLLPLKVAEPQARDVIRARPAVVCAQPVQGQGPDRHGPRDLPAVLDVRCQSGRELVRRRGRVLLGAAGQAAGAPRPLVSRVRPDLACVQR
jgi:Zn finger protein HypA/HybF involved in hydrogenase expression